MISLETIDKTILEHESKDTTYANCEKLAWLYIVRDHLREYEPHSNSQLMDINSKETTSTKENILPAYDSYIKNKKEFQLKNISKEKLIYSLDILSNEIKEFIKKLYRNSETPEEREKINNLINEINAGNI